MPLCTDYKPIIKAIEEYVRICESSLANCQKFFSQYYQHNHILENFLYGQIRPGLEFATCAFWRSHYKAFAYTDQEYRRFRHYLTEELRDEVPSAWLNELP